MAAPDRSQGPLRHRLRQRHRPRPPRHRHRRAGSAEPEPLSGGRHRLSVPAPAAMERRAPRSARPLVSSAMIDRVAARLGRRLVEVPVGFKWFVARAARRLARLRRRGKRRRGLPAPRRHGLDHRQGRHRRSPCWRPRSPPAAARDPGALYRELASAFGAPVYERIDAPATPRRKSSSPQLAPQRSRRPANWPASRSPPFSTKRPATARPSAASR